MLQITDPVRIGEDSVCNPTGQTRHPIWNCGVHEDYANSFYPDVTIKFMHRCDIPRCVKWLKEVVATLDAKQLAATYDHDAKFARFDQPAPKPPAVAQPNPAEDALIAVCNCLSSFKQERDRLRESAGPSLPF